MHVQCFRLTSNKICTGCSKIIFTTSNIHNFEYKQDINIMSFACITATNIFFLVYFNIRTIGGAKHFQSVINFLHIFWTCAGSSGSTFKQYRSGAHEACVPFTDGGSGWWGSLEFCPEVPLNLRI